MSWTSAIRAIVSLDLKLSCITAQHAAVEESTAPRIISSDLPRRVTVWLLAGSVALAPLYVVRWHYGPLPTTLLETLIFLTVAGYAWTLWSEKRRPSRTPYDVLIALWLVAGVLGIAAAPDHRAALGLWRAYFVEPAAMFYVAYDVLRTRDDLRKLFALSAISAVMYSIGQIFVFAWAVAHHSLLLGDAPSFLNSSPNADAMYLEPLLAFALAFVAFPWDRRTRTVAGVVTGFVFLAMLLTLSRAGYLAMAVLAVILVLRAVDRRWRYWVLAGLLVLAVVVVEVPVINQRVVTIGASAGLRESIYGQALRMLSQRPILGAGIDGFATRVAPFRPGSQEIEMYPHDIWLTTWSEVGLLGLIVFALILLTLLWRGIRGLSAANDDFRPVLWGAVGALILFAIHGLFDSPYWKNDFSLDFWMIAALVVVAIRGSRALRDPASPSPSPR